MKHFLQIAEGLDVLPLLLALQRQPQLWDAHQVRTTFPQSPHAAVSDILLRFQDLRHYEETGETAYIVDGHESIWFPAIHALPEARPHIFALMARVCAERLGRVILTKLAPGKEITPHKDSGDHAAYYSRFQVILASNPQCLFFCGDEVVDMRAGDCWYFDNSQEHSIENKGLTARIALIIDLKCSSLGGTPCT